MALRFLVLNRDRSIKLATGVLGRDRSMDVSVMLANEHTLSAGEMAAAFAAENGLATLVGTPTGGQVLGAGISPSVRFRPSIPGSSLVHVERCRGRRRGVHPHLEVPLQLPAQRGSVDSQLRAAIDTARAL
jgi:hypothetical protein